MIFSTSIHVVANGSILPLLWLNGILLHAGTTSLSKRTSAVSMSRSLWTEPQWTQGCRYLAKKCFQIFPPVPCVLGRRSGVPTFNVSMRQPSSSCPPFSLDWSLPGAETSRAHLFSPWNAFFSTLFSACSDLPSRLSGPTMFVSFTLHQIIDRCPLSAFQNAVYAAQFNTGVLISFCGVMLPASPSQNPC